MPKDNLVLVDTSVWIDYFLQRNSRLEKTMDLLLENSQVATAAIILAELTCGAKTEQEIRKLKEHLRPLQWIQSSDAHWQRAGELSFRLRQKGKTVNLSDCYIASLAHTGQATIFSLDKHFAWIAEIEGDELFEW